MSDAASIIDWPALRLAAEAVHPHAYAPYSKFRVAAALRGTDGRVFTGVNVENASYGLTVCAERNAVAAAVAAGCRRFSALYLVCSEAAPATPCGACRQVLAQFPPSFELRSLGASGEEVTFDVDALLPARFEFGEPG